MRSASVLRRIVVALSILTVSHALSLDDRAAAQDGKDLEKRVTLSLGIGTGGDGPTSTPDPTSDQSTPPSKTTNPPSSQTTTTSNTEKTTTTSSTPTSKTSSTPSSTSSSSASQSTTTVTNVITTTGADGSPTSYTSESTSTMSAGVAQGQDGNTSGMSTQTRNTVIGVVVGIGGAIVLLVAGLLAWRIWGRKRTPDENDGLVNYGGSYAPGVPEKSEASGSAGGRTPFQSTLESYHAPTQVNTASNF